MLSSAHRHWSRLQSHLHDLRRKRRQDKIQRTGCAELTSDCFRCLLLGQLVVSQLLLQPLLLIQCPRASPAVVRPRAFLRRAFMKPSSLSYSGWLFAMYFLKILVDSLRRW
jgi:hypothetical protein